MLKKILFISLFFLVALFIASAKADAVEAGQAILTVKFQNDGAIGLTVYYNFRDGGGQEFGYSSVWVPANASRTIWDTDEPVNQPYYVSWATDCDDPPVRQQGGDEDAFPDVSVYWATQYVTPTNSCGEPQITTISCPSPGTALTFSWQMYGRAAGLPYNVDKYVLIRETDANPDGSAGDYVTEVSASQTSVSWSGMTPGVRYYVRVNAKPPNIKLTFNVSAATAAQLKFYKNGSITGGTPINWSLNSSKSYTLSTWFWGLSPNANFTWEVEAGNSGGRRLAAHPQKQNLICLALKAGRYMIRAY